MNYNHITFCETNFKINRIEKRENINRIICIPKFLLLQKFLFVSKFSWTLTFYMKVSYEIQDFKLMWEHGKIAFPDKEWLFL